MKIKGENNSLGHIIGILLSTGLIIVLTLIIAFWLTR